MQSYEKMVATRNILARFDAMPEVYIRILWQEHSILSIGLLVLVLHFVGILLDKSIYFSNLSQ